MLLVGCAHGLTRNELKTNLSRTATKWHTIDTYREMPSPSAHTAFATRRAIERSWAFLFREGVQSAEHQELEAPIYIEKPKIPRVQLWLRTLIGRSGHGPDEHRSISMKSLMSMPTASDSFPEIKMHVRIDPFTNEESRVYRKVRETIQRNKQLGYNDFFVYGQRIRALRKHMDDRKPRDFWGLVHNRRNTLQYYTFWSVIAVGILSILLGLMSLAVGVLQAIFAYKALSLPGSSTTTNSSSTT